MGEEQKVKCTSVETQPNTLNTFGANYALLFCLDPINAYSSFVSAQLPLFKEVFPKSRPS